MTINIFYFKYYNTLSSKILTIGLELLKKIKIKITEKNNIDYRLSESIELIINAFSLFDDIEFDNKLSQILTKDYDTYKRTEILKTNRNKKIIETIFITFILGYLLSNQLRPVCIGSLHLSWFR